MSLSKTDLKLAPFLADKLSVDEQLIKDAIIEFKKSNTTVQKDSNGNTVTFVPLDKIKTLVTLEKKIENAKKEDKWLNADTTSIHGNSKKMRDKYEFYSSGVAGLPGSENVKKALVFFPGDLMEFSDESASVSSSKGVESLPPSPAKGANIKQHESGVYYVAKGAYAYDPDTQEVYGKIDLKTGDVKEGFTKKQDAALMKRGLKFKMQGTESDEEEVEDDGKDSLNE